jgi:antitoxin (DNA-binding transcriptional repressor) of toxin-antitoxin stability system
VRELKARLSSYLDTVKGGGEVLVTERGQIIARIVPVIGGSEEALARLIAEGRVLPPEAGELIIPERVQLEGGSVEDLIREQRG